ncbi:hypothetical protein OV079_29975 [Nannocystis pusilla]|uniref:Uncharacterized protein n=1 Tax=Nannocystis pusilla TaxID=889268 RepID=A0A9X3J0J8_9BACT|nr:hypothetical protein [Nannocystis pusilla]MCY1009719.1 hypothetical protein [Nannocystis pusilla]
MTPMAPLPEAPEREPPPKLLPVKSPVTLPRSLPTIPPPPTMPPPAPIPPPPAIPPPPSIPPLVLPR